MTSTTIEKPFGNTLTVRYELDQKDRIVKVGGDWDTFATANGAEELTKDAVIGHPLRRYVLGDVTRMFIDTMLTKVRVTGTPFSVPYRCDSPGTKRFMEMSLFMSSLPGIIVAEHRLVKEQPMPPLSIWAADARANSSAPGQLFKRCSMCNRLAGRDGIPIEPDKLQRPDPGSPLRVIYYVCQACQSSIRHRLASNRVGEG